MGTIDSLWQRYQSPILAFTFVWCLLGVFTNVAGLLHVTSVVHLETMTDALGASIPRPATFVLTAVWWAALAVGTGWSYLQCYEVQR